VGSDQLLDGAQHLGIDTFIEAVMSYTKQNFSKRTNELYLLCLNRETMRPRLSASRLEVVWHEADVTACGSASLTRRITGAGMAARGAAARIAGLPLGDAMVFRQWGRCKSDHGTSDDVPGTCLDRSGIMPYIWFRSNSAIYTGVWMATRTARNTVAPKKRVKKQAPRKEFVAHVQNHAVRQQPQAQIGAVVSLGEKEARIEIRLKRSLKQLIEVAAAAQGQTLSAFIISHAVSEARTVVDTSTRMELSMADWERFQRALANPKPPNTALRAAAKHYKASIMHSDGL
jgi:uncharacterized protein (DUF1778 family)